MKKIRKKAIKNAFSARSLQGATITELLIATVLLGVTMAALGEIMGLMTILSGRANNKASALDSARNAINRISSDVRSARAFADMHSGNLIDRNIFPSSNNPVYGSGGISISGAPYKLSEHTLIVQTPVFYTSSIPDPSSLKYNIFPVAFKTTSTTMPPISVPSPLQDVENVDTIVYDVVSDGTTGNFTLETKRYPGAYVSSYPSGIQQSSYKSMIDNPSQRILKDIIGPKSKSGSSFPVVFKYYGKNTNGKTFQIDPLQFDANPALVNSIIGVGINIEIKKSGSASSSNNLHDQQIGIHDEVFARTNRKGLI
ncbi:MAG: hypothetical protein IPG59_05625 [Candidatus Melainabacteria bacterium]|nr:MAG: hypothetical protein IPG59_05625 [Candidatus Melainabacteria bacterium]